MSFQPVTRKPSWAKRIGGAVALWASICGLGVLAEMSPRPLFLAGLVAALSTAAWLMSDSIQLAEPTDWHIVDEPIARPRGADSRVVTLEHVIADGPSSASSRLRLHHVLTALADERLLSLRGIDRRSDPAGARAALGPELDDFMARPDPGQQALSTGRIAQLLNRIESL